ncbi:uncharacterized protein LOC133780498 [Humulus lupulus]|uniref:uncharacterized protein LOC133780498 n=1 Tax=Humulus lupulus TaxID=3486 RepID=UPI002B405836|nr:uncharacterized protein LOC133780498 [Humulus lupulus]
MEEKMDSGCGTSFFFMQEKISTFISNSRHSNLSLNVEVHVKPAIPNPKVEHDGKNFSTVIENNKKVFEEDLLKIGSVVRILEEKCVKLNEEKEKIEQTMKKLQGFDWLAHL